MGMLGYELTDLEEMIRSVGLAKKSVSSEKMRLLGGGGEEAKRIIEGLNKAHDILQGLWAEGYFD